MYSFRDEAERKFLKKLMKNQSIPPLDPNNAELSANAKARGWGIGRGFITIDDSFDEPLPPEIQESFEN